MNLKILIMKNIGIWMDKEKAHVVSIEDDREEFTTLQSEVENFHVKGGARSKTLWGPQDVVNETKYLKRKNQQLKNYFKKIAEKIEDADAVALFGPAGTNDKFEKELMVNYRRLAQKVKIVKKVDSMTHNQVKALVRDFFNRR